MTLCASNVDPSEQAKVTSTKSCLEWRSRKVEATLTVKSFHFKLYFWVDPIAYLMDISASLFRCHNRFNYIDVWHNHLIWGWYIFYIDIFIPSFLIYGINWTFHQLFSYFFSSCHQKFPVLSVSKSNFGCQLVPFDDAYVIGWCYR